MRLTACVVCGNAFRPRRGQRACGTVCGAKLHTQVLKGQAPRNHTRTRADESERYGTEHQRLREQWKSRVEAGQVNCARCGRWIDPQAKWDLGHDDIDRTIYRGPEHARCNRATSRHRAERKGSRRQLPAWWGRS